MSSDLTPSSSEKSIQDHLKHYYSQIHSYQDFSISTLYNYYRLLHPSLHKKVEENILDISALNYALPRLPNCILTAHQVIIAQSQSQLTAANIDISSWELQGSSSRRRQNYYDHITKTLLVLINSDSDIDDLINCLICVQIERQKISQIDQYQLGLLTTAENYSALGIDESTWQKFKAKLGQNWQQKVIDFSHYNDITIRSLPQDNRFITDVVAAWWHKISTTSLIFSFQDTPLYFVSSNLHSLTNLIGGYVNDQQDKIIHHISQNYTDLYSQWLSIKTGTNSLRVIDFLYYASGKYFADNPTQAADKIKYEEQLGIRQLNIGSQLPCDVQIIPVSAIAKSPHIDPNLKIANPDKLLSSSAYLLNIEYPLGFSAYFILNSILNMLTNLKGVYIIGKAAILSGQIGDIQIPSAVFDERTNNIFNIPNIFNSYFPFPSFQSDILQNQKAISVYGTYLENENQLQNYIKSGFNIIEMESGPYLTAIHQHLNSSTTYPQNIVTDIKNLPYDLGIINYASDNPLSQTLGDSVMSLRGVEPTYLAALSVIQRIVDLELA
ncbi:MAG: hypothetical protein WAV41_05120 [Microgenomates group bacterium]